ncbi:MAG: hypothetical protein ACHQRM_14500 [Bacteroidia bacterium]
MDIIREKNHYKGISLVTGLCLRVGGVTLAFLILYFLLMDVFGFGRIIWLRAFNMVILGWGILVGLRQYKGLVKSNIEYFTGLRIGALISLIAVIPFAVMTGIYLSIDTGFMNYLVSSMSIGMYLNPATAAAAIMAEGIVSGLIFTFIVMPYFKEQ